ncbi:14541_t:CDS:2, partial [Cetraspora pellucida]
NDNSDDDNFIEEIAYFTKNLTARHIQFSAISVEYPPTHPEVQRAMKDKARVVFRDIQYSQSGKGGSSTVNCPFFDEPNNEKIQIIKDQRKCGGIKICPFAHEHIMHYKHTDVDFDSNIFQTIKNTEESR